MIFPEEPKKGGTDQVRSKYGRNRFGGVTWRRDVQAHAQSPAVDTEDNFYWYDALYQVKERQRGDLTGTAPDYTGISNLQQDEAWTYDATGNWQASSNTAPTSAQARINNTANEITLLSSAAGDITPAYDPAGNMTTLPKAPGTATAQYDLKWDAWNRLVEVKDGSTVVASYTYDGLTRRLTKSISGDYRHYYYDAQWRTVEERVNGNKERQYTWGLRDRWDLLRRTITNGATHFCLRDYLDPVAIVGTDGEIKERYTYDAFGNVRFLAPDYSSRSVSDFGWDFLFHAEFRDPDTKLYNYGYRYYDTGLGRWLSRDPIGEKGGFNAYVALLNECVDKIDSLGLSPAPFGAYPFPGINPPPGANFNPWTLDPLMKLRKRLLIHYGPWKCTGQLIGNCKTECANKGQPFRGCVYIARLDYYLLLPFDIEKIGVFHFYQCCCACPDVDPEPMRNKFNSTGRGAFRSQFQNSTGLDFPLKPDGSHWDVHHILPLFKGGTNDPGNLIPVPPAVHQALNLASKNCYNEANNPWSIAGPGPTPQDTTTIGTR